MTANCHVAWNAGSTSIPNGGPIVMMINHENDFQRNEFAKQKIVPESYSTRLVNLLTFAIPVTKMNRLPLTTQVKL